VRRSTGIEYVSSGTGTVRQHPDRIHCVPRADQAGACPLPERQCGDLRSPRWAREESAPKLVDRARACHRRQSSCRLRISRESVAGLPDAADAQPRLRLHGHGHDTWHMLAGQLALPKEIVARSIARVVKIVERPDIRRHFEIDAAETKAMTPAELKEFVRGEVEKWTPVVQAATKPE